MDALKFWNELQRICGIFKSCDDCPLYEEVCMGCSLYDIEDIKRTIQIVEQWSKEYPQKTRLQDFFWESTQTLRRTLTERRKPVAKT